MNSDKALAYALNLIASAPKSTFQLKTKLRQKGASEEVVSEVIEKLEGWGYLDDAEYGTLLMESYKRKGKSRAYIRQKMKEKGVNASLAEQILENGYSEEEEKEIAAQNYGQKEGIPSKKRVQSLIRQGFRYDTLSGLVEK